MTKTRIKARVSTSAVINTALEFAVERGMNRHDKYSSEPLSETSRSLLLHEIQNSFWLALEDASVELG